MSRDLELGFIGAGNMAEAICRGILDGDVLAAGQILAFDPNAKRQALFRDELNVATAVDNAELLDRCRTIILAVKPQYMAEALEPVAGKVGADQLVITIAAGISTSWIANLLGPAPLRVVRVMPNTPMLVGAGMSVLCPGVNATEMDVQYAEKLFAAAGQTLIVTEDLMDAVTAVSGSGPAYFFYFVEALIAGGVQAGLSEAQTAQLAKATITGAAKLLTESDDSPAELRRKVTSPGGTTEAAINSMTEGKVSEQITQAVAAAAARGKELGR